MISTADFKKGLRLLIDGEPYTLADIQVQMPAARGANTLVKIRARHVLTRQVIDRTLKAGERFEEPDLAFRGARLLYADDEQFHFMDQESYEQFGLQRQMLVEQAAWLTEDIEVRAVLLDGRVLGIELPQFVELEVTSVEPAARGDTATGKILKNAVLSNGVTVRVPAYIAVGERVRIDTGTGEFVERAARV